MIKLRIENLPLGTTQDTLREFLSLGENVEVAVPLDDVGETRGFAFVGVPAEDVATAVCARIQREPLQGRPLSVSRVQLTGGARGRY